MRNEMRIGYVFKFAPGFYGVVSYYPQTTVQMFLSERDDASIYTVCHEIGRKFAGRFEVADRDTEAWGRIVFKAQGSALVM